MSYFATSRVPWVETTVVQNNKVMSDLLRNRLALIVGGSGAIGTATAGCFAAQGAIVLLGFHANESKALAAIRSLPGYGHQAMQIDATSTASIRSVVSNVANEFGKLDILVNASGFTRQVSHESIHLLSDELFDEMMRQNVRAAFSLVRECHSLLLKGKDSCIVNVSSTSAVSGRGSNMAYSASKAALNCLGLSLARVLGPEIRLLTVAPGSVNTNFVPERSREDFEAYAAKTALRKIITASDVAAAILACVAFMPSSSGTVVTLDGCPV